MIVYWQNTVRLIGYEDSFSHSGGRNVPPGHRKLPVYHDFTFHKVAMDKFALTQRRKGGFKNSQLLTSDEDEPDDDILNRDQSGPQRARYPSSMNSNSFSTNASSSIKIVKTAKDKKQP